MQLRGRGAVDAASIVIVIFANMYTPASYYAVINRL